MLLFSTDEYERNIQLGENRFSSTFGAFEIVGYLEKFSLRENVNSNETIAEL